MVNEDILRELIKSHPKLLPLENKVREAAEYFINCFRKGGKVLACGNGGSSSDADHIVGELMKGFEKKRPVDEYLKDQLESISVGRGKYISSRLQQGLAAVSLTANGALLTAIANDIDPDLIFAQQVCGLGNQGDILLGITTSGNSTNIIDAAITAKAKGMTVIGLTGESGGRIKQYCDILINVPGNRTSLVQELHLPVYHVLCSIIEDALFPGR